MAMEASELARWTRFAAKGGIGKCTALVDCIAENPDDLMFLRGDEITVLMQLPEPSGVFLGYCEGVVGRFYGVNVHIHGKLKKPVMTKRSSVNATNSSGARKSPTPAGTRTRISIDEHGAATFVLPPSSPETLPSATKTIKSRLSMRPGSRVSAGQERSDGEYGSSRDASPAIPPTLSPSSKGTPPPLHTASPPPPPASYASPKPPLRTSVSPSKHTSVLSSYSQVIESEEPSVANTSIDTVTDAKIDAPSNVSTTHQPTASPPLATMITTTTTSWSPATTTTTFVQPTPPNLPASISTLSNSSLYASSSATSVATTTATPSTSHTITSPPPTSLSTASTNPDTSTSAFFHTSRLSIADDDGEVGIGLSLLQNLVDSDGWSGSESDSDRVAPRRKASVGRRGSAQRRASLKRRSVARSSVISEGSMYSSEEGLNYADTEMGHSLHSPAPAANPTRDELEANLLQTQAAFSQHLDDDDDIESPVLGRHENRNTINQQMVLTFPPVAPLSPSPSRSISNGNYESYPSTYEFPTPPTHTHRISLSQASTASTSTNSRPTSFIRPRLPESTSTTTTTTRPSTAQSAQSSQSHTSSNWDGDIYDDYRYSRFSSSTRSFSSRVSIGSRVNGLSGSGSGSVVGTGTGGWPPERMERPSIDGASSVGTASLRGSVDIRAERTRSRSNTTASLNPVVLSPVVPQAAAQTRSPPPPRTPPTHSPASSIQQQPSPRSRQLESSRAIGIGHRMTDSESEGSVYSARGSRINGSVPLSPRLDGSFSLPPSPLISTSFGTNKSSIPDTNSNTSTSTNMGTTRPTPLNLTSSNYTSPVPSVPQSPRSPNHQQQQHQRQNSTPSPLLHTHWGSAVSSPASAARYATLPLMLPHDSTTAVDTVTSGSPPSTGGREVSAYFPRGVDVLGRVVVQQDVDIQVSRKGEDEQVGLVLGGQGDDEQERMEDEGREEERDEDEDGVGEDTTFVIGDGVLYESPSIASSPETEPDAMSKRRAAPPVISNRTTSSMVEDDEEDAEELEKEKEKLRREAASVTNAVPAPVPAPAQQEIAPPPSGSPAPTATNDIPPPPPSPPLPTTSPASSHLRPPQLSDIYASGERQSLFLPHPNAPKATPTSLSPGPMYITSQTQPPSPQPNAQRVRGGVIQAIHRALSGHGAPSGPRGRGPTIYGVVTADLSAAMGPVPMRFTVSPPPATVPPFGSVPPPSVPRAATTPPHTQVPTTPTPPVPALVPRIAVRRVGSVASLDITPEVERPGSGTGGVIPRANFFPKAGGVRPRSRSFSGFQSMSSEIPLALQHSRDSNDQPAQILTASKIKRSLSPIAGSPTAPIASAKLGPRPSPLREVSPAPPRPPRSPNSPLAQSFAAPYTQTSSSSVPSSPTTRSPPRLLRQTASRSTLSDASIPLRSVAHTRSTLDGGGNSPSLSVQQIPELRGRSSVENDSFSIHSSKSNLTSPPPTAVGRQNSLRTKLSLPNLRRNANKPDEQPISTTVDSDLLQVQDMDFQLVRPSLGHLHDGRSSEDSGVMGRDMSVDVRQDGSFLRAESPALSLTAPRSPTYLSDANSSSWQLSKSSGRGGTDSEASSTSMMEAHRSRELKWMAVVGSVQPSQSRKSKKVKKLVFDGVPASVRYIVWSMLADGKARFVPGVYGQLGSRAKVASLADIERDVQRCSADHPQLQNTQGPVISLLQAYLTMVPDVQYVTGLALIAGNLLLHAPEEDAFWIFVSLMDLHIRPYFSSASAQIDVDATLFGRSMDNVDSAMAKKLFGELNISPLSICRPWFTSLFVGCLPSNYLNRVWDIFLFEGVPFLFRVAHVLVSCSRRQIFDTTSADAALSAVLYPSPELLPTSPEALITLALAVKVKDDDLRKQRVKLGAQTKRQTLAPRTGPRDACSLPSITLSNTQSEQHLLSFSP